MTLIDTFNIVLCVFAGNFPCHTLKLYTCNKCNSSLPCFQSITLLTHQYLCVWVCLLKYSMLGPCSCLLTDVLLGVSLDNPTQISKTGFPHGNKNLKHVFIEMFPAHGRFLTLVLYCESNAHKKTYCIPLTRVGKSHRRYPVTAQVSEVCKIGLWGKKRLGCGFSSNSQVVFRPCVNTLSGNTSVTVFWLFLCWWCST